MWSHVYYQYGVLQSVGNRLCLQAYMKLELSDSCDLSIIMIVSNNRGYNSMQSYYRDKLCISVLSQKEVNMILLKLR